MVSGIEIRVDMVVGGQRGDTQASGWTWGTVLWSPGVEPSGWLDIGWVTSLELIRKELLEVRILNRGTRFGPHCCGLRCRSKLLPPRRVFWRDSLKTSDGRSTDMVRLDWDPGWAWEGAE